MATWSAELERRSNNCGSMRQIPLLTRCTPHRHKKNQSMGLSREWRPRKSAPVASLQRRFHWGNHAGGVAAYGANCQEAQTERYGLNPHPETEDVRRSGRRCGEEAAPIDRLGAFTCASEKTRRRNVGGRQGCAHFRVAQLAVPSHRLNLEHRICIIKSCEMKNRNSSQ